ncbi:hypothetical protein L1987_79968 [Smallanthus sonchifolius]|uniref:Uncharacterized protein n=1 Tax=Smallanthus sonchifolius TaxID=185202 RepID=A0ACB8YKM0_9ASTR|nr:hypothetical protein L1987_79968 [Smallanthus sonchifolius]
MHRSPSSNQLPSMESEIYSGLMIHGSNFLDFSLLKFMEIQHGIVEKIGSDSGKLFIGGVSWDTDEDRLKEYFSSYGEVIEAVIMRDRVTGRARGFGFVVFADPAVAERVAMEKHMIDDRTVEKKAVPREDHHGLTRNSSSIQGSLGPGVRTKKIFVGGLASTVTESDFKKYFDQFGGITDVVVMYDHNTQRPRGFGFITFDSEDEVDRVLLETFHELNGKMVEVKRAVPKELSAGPNCSSLVGFNYGFTRPNTLFTSTYPQDYSRSPNGGYGGRADSLLSPVGGGLTGFSPFGSSGYGIGMNLDPGLNPGVFGIASNNIGYGRVVSPNFGGYSNSWFTSPGGSGTYLGSGSSGFGIFGNGPNWGSSPIPTQDGMSSSGYNNGACIGPIGGPENNYGLALGRNGPSIDHEASYGNLYRWGLMYGDPTWQTSPTDLDGPGSGPGSFSYGLDISEDVGSYSIANRQTNRDAGIAA